MTEDRVIWRLSGRDVTSFLQGVVSNDVLPLDRAPGIVWAALLTPQGKYLADFFVVNRPQDAAGALLIDIPADLAADTQRRLLMYRLRADVQIHDAGLYLERGIGAPPEGAQPDPRHPALPWRRYVDLPAAAFDDRALRVEHLVPAYPEDLRPDESYILEAGFERLHGVDFRKGCYVGQEVTARMKHKTELRKGLVRLAIAGEAAPGTPITLADGREAGVLGTVWDGRALAHMRFDRMAEPLLAGGAQLAAE
ncbi:MAG: folate-binding protein YgfZ [Rhodobacteraceae bacterium]|jgi:folate-binding protein YgfZ|nr:folate-binding protein YgfZ [Paracoccaceae bacterium]